MPALSLSLANSIIMSNVIMNIINIQDKEEKGVDQKDQKKKKEEKKPIRKKVRSHSMNK